MILCKRVNIRWLWNCPILFIALCNGSINVLCRARAQRRHSVICLPRRTRRTAQVWTNISCLLLSGGKARQLADEAFAWWAYQQQFAVIRDVLSFKKYSEALLPSCLKSVNREKRLFTCTIWFFAVSLWKRSGFYLIFSTIKVLRVGNMAKTTVFSYQELFR